MIETKAENFICLTQTVEMSLCSVYTWFIPFNVDQFIYRKWDITENMLRSRRSSLRCIQRRWTELISDPTFGVLIQVLTFPVWAIVISWVFTALPPSPFSYGFSDYDEVMSQHSASSLLPRRQASSVALFTPAKRMVRSRQTIDGVTPNPLVTLGAVPEARYQDAARQPHRWHHPNHFLRGVHARFAS